MKDIDEKIREALRQEDSQLVESLRGERALHEMIIESFRSRHRWLYITAFVMPFIFIVLVFVFGYQFFQAESVRAMIAWATGALWAAIATGMFKLMYMMELNKNSVTREIKRLELELVQLSRRLPEK
jgi:hypothetical protein